MLKTLIAGVAAAALLGSAVYVFAAGTDVTAGAGQPASMGDGFDSRWAGAVCSQQAWPYYDSSCLRDASRPGNRARAVRVVSTDRSPTTMPATPVAK